MFINEPERYRTIDHERNIELTQICTGKEGHTSFMLKIGDKKIPFGAHSAVLESDDAGVTDLIWRVTQLGRIVAGLNEIKYVFSGENEEAQTKEIISEALKTYGMLFGSFNTRVVAVEFE